MGDAALAPELTFRLDNAVQAGAVAGFSTLLLVYAMLAVKPMRFPMNPLYLIGSATSIDTTYAYLSGLLMFVIGIVAYGSVIAAVQIGFEVGSNAYLWGIGTGLFLYIVSGTTLAYARTLHRGVRAGQIGDPGSFMLNYGRVTVVQFAVAHLLFGAITGQLYSAFS